MVRAATLGLSRRDKVRGRVSGARSDGTCCPSLALSSLADEVGVDRVQEVKVGDDAGVLVQVPYGVDGGAPGRVLQSARGEAGVGIELFLHGRGEVAALGGPLSVRRSECHWEGGSSRRLPRRQLLVVTGEEDLYVLHDLRAWWSRGCLW